MKQASGERTYLQLLFTPFVLTYPLEMSVYAQNMGSFNAKTFKITSKKY